MTTRSATSSWTPARPRVGLGLVRRDRQRPTAVYFKDPTASGTKVYYYRSGSAAAALSVADVPAWRARRPAVTHVSGVTAALSASTWELTRHVVRDRPLGPSLVSFDVNHRPSLWDTGRGPAELLDLARHSDVVFVGRDEAQTLWGTSDAESVRDLLDGPAHVVVRTRPWRRSRSPRPGLPGARQEGHRGGRGRRR
ncbi:PfkB family carbohydrate kinase [Streptomyces sp. M19]